MTTTIDGIRRHAEISECGQYRYMLRRVWDNDLPRCAWIMLNPSTADASVDDPTIRKCIGFAQRWGFGSIVVANLFAFRSTDSGVLRDKIEHVGDENDRWILNATSLATRIVCAWGSHPAARFRGAVVRQRLSESCKIHALKLSKDGSPWHPLYVPYSTEPLDWTAKGATDGK